MSLEDFGARTWASLREPERDETGEVVCPISEIPTTSSRGEIRVPVAQLRAEPSLGVLLGGRQLTLEGLVLGRHTAVARDFPPRSRTPALRI